MSDEVYDPARARQLEQMLGALARHILDLEVRGELLPHAAELLSLLGDCRSELFHYEVHVTYDTPEVARNRRLVAEARQQTEDELELPSPSWTPENPEERSW